MVLMLLTIIFFAGGFISIIYSVLAMLSMLKYSQAKKVLPEKFTLETGKPATAGPPIVEVYCQRASILLKNERFDAALADCKRAIDINPKHAEANFLWKHALEREIPPEPVSEPTVEAMLPPAETEPAKKKAKKVVKKIKRRKKVVATPIPAEKPPEAAPLPPEPEEVGDIAITPELEEAEPAIELKAETAVEPVTETKPAAEIAEEADAVLKEPFPEQEITMEEGPSVELEPEKDEPVVELEPEAEVILEETLPEEDITVEEEPPVELEPEKDKPAIELETEAEDKPAAESEISEKTEQDAPVAREPLPGEEEGPLIPADKLAAIKPAGESLLEEFDHEKLREFEEGEAEAGDKEWTQFADKKGPKLPDSKIDMNELPASATGLKETLSDLRQAEAYNLQGEYNIEKNLYNKALKDFSRALEINPNYVDGLINRGSAYAKLGRFNDALLDFNHALKFEKKDAELYNKRGEIYLQSNMYDQAIKDFTAALVLNPMFSDVYLNRGRAYSEKGMPDEAMADFNQAIKTDSDHADFSFIDRAAPGVNVEEESTGNTEEAAKFNQLGQTDLKNKKYKEAAENFSQAIKLASSDAAGYINRGRAYIALKKPDQAIADFNQAVLFDPLNAPLYYWRALAWKTKKDPFNMAEDLKLSCELGYGPACLEYKKSKPAK
jgi:tetratricopeptide (TPR) repeat protein